MRFATFGRHSSELFRRSQMRFPTFGRDSGEPFRRSQMRFAKLGRRSGALFRRLRMRIATLGRLVLAKLRRAFSYSLTCHEFHSEVSNGRVATRSFARFANRFRNVRARLGRDSSELADTTRNVRAPSRRDFPLVIDAIRKSQAQFGAPLLSRRASERRLSAKSRGSSS